MGLNPYEQIVQVKLCIHDLEGCITGAYDVTMGMRLDLDEAKTMWSTLTKMVDEISVGFMLSMHQIISELHDLKEYGHAHNEKIDNVFTGIVELKELLQSQHSEMLGQ
jgi:hypothetical protein